MKGFEQEIGRLVERIEGAMPKGELCRVDVPIVKDILQAESRFGIVLQGFERHVLDEMGWQPEYNSEWRTAPVNRSETREIVPQRPDQSVNQCTVLF